MSFGGETSGSVAKCWLFSQAKGGSVCSQGGLLHSPRIFFPRERQRGSRDLIFLACAGRRFSARRITTISCFYRAMFRYHPSSTGTVCKAKRVWNSSEKRWQLLCIFCPVTVNGDREHLPSIIRVLLSFKQKLRNMETFSLIPKKVANFQIF